MKLFLDCSGRPFIPGQCYRVKRREEYLLCGEVTCEDVFALRYLPGRPPFFSELLITSPAVTRRLMRTRQDVRDEIFYLLQQTDILCADDDRDPA